ncbi:hypothetical protein LCGC14_2150090, partial [marine sediment metagenome]
RERLVFMGPWTINYGINNLVNYTDSNGIENWLAQDSTDEMVSKSIETTMVGSPKAEDYYAAAVYYLESDKDISKAQEWMNKAMEMTDEPAFWQLRQQSLIQAKAGDTKNAIKTAKMSLDKAKEAGNDDYVKMNTDSLKEWGAK